MKCIRGIFTRHHDTSLSNEEEQTSQPNIPDLNQSNVDITYKTRLKKGASVNDISEFGEAEKADSITALPEVINKKSRRSSCVSRGDFADLRHMTASTAVLTASVASQMKTAARPNCCNKHFVTYQINAVPETDSEAKAAHRMLCERLGIYFMKYPRMDENWKIFRANKAVEQGDTTTSESEATPTQRSLAHRSSVRRKKTAVVQDVLPVSQSDSTRKQLRQFEVCDAKSAACFASPRTGSGTPYVSPTAITTNAICNKSPDDDFTHSEMEPMGPQNTIIDAGNSIEATDTLFVNQDCRSSNSQPNIPKDSVIYAKSRKILPGPHIKSEAVSEKPHSISTSSDALSIVLSSVSTDASSADRPKSCGDNPKTEETFTNISPIAGGSRASCAGRKRAVASPFLKPPVSTQHTGYDLSQYTNRSRKSQAHELGNEHRSQSRSSSTGGKPKLFNHVISPGRHTGYEASDRLYQLGVQRALKRNGPPNKRPSNPPSRCSSLGSVCGNRYPTDAKNLSRGNSTSVLANVSRTELTHDCKLSPTSAEVLQVAKKFYIADVDSARAAFISKTDRRAIQAIRRNLCRWTLFEVMDRKRGYPNTVVVIFAPTERNLLLCARDIDKTLLTWNLGAQLRTIDYIQ